MREYVATAKTVEEAIQLGCEALSVDRDDLGMSYEILEMPQKTGFLGLKVTPAKVKVTVETADTEPETTPAAPVAAAEPEPAPAEEAAEQPAAEDAAPAEAETPLDIAADPRLQAAVDYLTPIFHLMGVEEFTFTAGKKEKLPFCMLRVPTWAHSLAAAAKRWRAFPIWQAWWSTGWKALTSSWASMWAATAISAKTT